MSGIVRVMDHPCPANGALLMPSPRRAVFLDHQSLDLGDLDLSPLQSQFDEFELFAATRPEQVAERLQGAVAVVSNKVMLDAATLAANPQLKLILVAATGTNNVDLAAARAQGITVCNCQGYGTPSVAQHTLAMLLALATRLCDYNQAVADGQWAKASQFCLLDFPIVELEGKTLGLLGHGELGGAVARLAEAFGMRVLSGQIPGRPERADRLPLDERHLGGAATDVLSVEPPVNGNPLLEPGIPRLIITPHSAWGAVESRQRIVGQLSENAQAFFAGQARRVVS